MTKKLKIVSGPEKFELLSNFGLREPIRFKVDNKEEVELILNVIGHEDGSGHSFLLMGGYTTDNKYTIEKGYYRESEKTGYLHLQETR